MATAWRPPSNKSGHLHRAAVGRFLEAAPAAISSSVTSPNSFRASRHVRRLEASDALEERTPTSGVVEPAFPENIETFFDRIGQPPKRDRAGRIENLRASCGSDHANRSRLRKVVGPRQTTAQHGRSLRPELPIRIPPAREIHFADARDDGSDLEKPLKIQGFRFARLVAYDCDFIVYEVGRSPI